MKKLSTILTLAKKHHSYFNRESICGPYMCVAIGRLYADKKITSEEADMAKTFCMGQVSYIANRASPSGHTYQITISSALILADRETRIKLGFSPTWANDKELAEDIKLYWLRTIKSLKEAGR